MFDGTTAPFVQERGSAEPPEPGMPLERLEHEIVKLAAQINAGTRRWLELVAEFDRREGWASWSCRSCAEWVAWRCALDTRSAREHVRVARRLGELPLIHAAFARGELSYSKVRALTRVAEPDSEADLLELASQATAAQLERIVRGLRRVSTADATESHAMRYLSTWWEADGTLSISGSLPAEEGAAFLIALDAMHDLIRATAAGEAEPSVAPACGGAPSGPAEPASEADACGSAEPPDPGPPPTPMPSSRWHRPRWRARGPGTDPTHRPAMATRVARRPLIRRRARAQASSS